MCAVRLKLAVDDGLAEAQLAVELLSRASSYPESTKQVERIDTHISHVFLTDSYVYKLKKPVKYEFLDFTTPQLRHEACEQEVRLNRRLAPDVYLGVVPITSNRRGQLKLGGRGVSVDWVVKMRRLPADRALDRLVVSQAVGDAEIRRLAVRLADFYQQLPPLTLRTDEYRRHIQEHVLANRRELLDSQHGLDQTQVMRVHAAQRRLLRLAPELLDGRVCDGRVVEGHGDLRPEHIYLTPAPLIIDCIEFNAEFRQLDVLDELGFLSMECDRLGAESVGTQIIEQYQSTSGDRPPDVLLSFYKCYRACVRAKVLALRDAQISEAGFKPDGLDAAPDCPANPLHTAREYLDLADRYAARLGRPLLVIVCGLPGSGKSTLAESLAATLDIEVLQTDAIRRELFGKSDQPVEYNQRQYTPAGRATVYEEMLRRAGKRLEKHLSVILDGTFLKADSRTAAVRPARFHGAEPLFVRCECSDHVSRERIAARIHDGLSLSETQPDFLESQKRDHEPDPPDLPVLSVDTTNSQPAILATVFQRLRDLVLPDATTAR